MYTFLCAFIRLYTSHFQLRRVVGSKDKLENLCRALQRANKELIEDEKQKRADQHNRVDAIVADVQGKIDAFSADQRKIADENEMLRQQIESLTKAIDLTQKQAKAEVTAKDLEVGLKSF